MIRRILFETAWLWPWMLVSLLIHLALGAPVEWWFSGQMPPQRKMLVLDWEGMMSEHQLEEKQQGDPADSKKKETSQQHQESPKVQQQSKNVLQQTAESPVAAEQVNPQPNPTAVSAVPKASSVQADKGEDENREQQTIRNRDAEMDAMRKYLEEASQVIMSRLVYPNRLRLAGYTGRTLIRFRIDASGGIVAGTLAVASSSGHAQLDEQALAAARASVPLPRPPKPMEAVIAMSFNKDKPGAH